jgi:hypothetical protein
LGDQEDVELRTQRTTHVGEQKIDGIQ